jgi:Nuclease-related domain/UvrD-like helicase C-terminal domain/Uncharacterized conserved protein (DUF2075)
MARLIPAFMDDTTPPGERDVFNMLAGGPPDWVALHSLDVAPWNRGLRTEIDFVVVAPDTGVLCIEVKSHDAISFENDRWQPPTIKRSPFKQASDGRHALYRGLKEIAPQLKHVPIVHCCIFPNAQFDLGRTLSVHGWELMDVRVFRAFTSAESFCAELKARMIKSITSDANLQRLTNPLSRWQIDDLIRSCLPVQKRRPDAREEIVRREEQIERILREQQKPVLRLAELNDRVVVSGGAGTGKTLIALEIARRVAEDGRRVGLLCFNQMIGDWLEDKAENLEPKLPNLLVGRAVRVMAQMAEIKIPEQPSTDFWDNALPEILEQRLTDPDFSSVAAFDYLVIDEAQDLLARPALWCCVVGFLMGGLSNGKFCLFGDFDNQILGDREIMEEQLMATDASARPVRWKLAENCRNYRIVGDTALQLAGLNSKVYSGYMRVGGGVQNYNISFYTSESEQLSQLSQWLKEFKAQRYKPSEITILSFRAGEACAAAHLKDRGLKIAPAWQCGDHTGYASVHAFKGLENKIILLTDVLLEERNFHRYLFYTGMTRATEVVRVLCDIRSKETLFSWLNI